MKIANKQALTKTPTKVDFVSVYKVTNFKTQMFCFTTSEEYITKPYHNTIRVCTIYDIGLAAEIINSFRDRYNSHPNHVWCFEQSDLEIKIKQTWLDESRCIRPL